MTICIPTYNHAHFLPSAIKSAIAQSERNIEIIVVDNCSTDATGQLVSDFAAHDSRVKYVKNSENIGLVGNLNRCLELARGAYIKYLLADDLLEPDAVRQMLVAFTNNTDLKLVASQRLLVDTAEKPVRVAGFKTLNGKLDGRMIIGHTLFNGNYIGEPTAVMFRRGDAIRGYSGEFKRLVDVEMWFHLLEQGDLYYIDRPLVRIRQHESQETHSIIRDLGFIDEEVRLYRSFIARSYLRVSFISRLKWRFKTAWIYPFNQAWQADCGVVAATVCRAFGRFDLLTAILVARILLSRVLNPVKWFMYIKKDV